MPTIEKRKTKNGTIKYRTKVRIKGFPDQNATFESKAAAKNWGNKVENEIREGRWFKTNEATKHTLSELIIRYLGYIQNHYPKRHTYLTMYLKWWDKKIGARLLSDITKPLLLQQREKLLNTKGHNVENRSKATANRYMAALSGALTIAVDEWEWLTENPMNKITNLPESRGRVRFLSGEERTSLLNTCRNNEKLYLLVVLALSTGARHGELINLHWHDIDLTRKVITLHETKNGERRILSIGNNVLKLLKTEADLRKAMNSERINNNGYFFDLFSPNDLLFPSAKNHKKPWNSRAAWEKALRDADIKDFRFHDLRHSAASYLAMSGASLNEIAEILGHKTLQMVKRYAHLSDSHIASVVERMNEKIFAGE